MTIGIGRSPRDAPGGLDPVEPRHLDVEDGEIGLLAPGQLDRLLAVARLGADLEARRAR